ncbi:MAG: fibronectin type III domain-containing protein, partial [Prevotella sp.]|nr:fibronectin type III domain-containing protein [Prevotella sp.]
MTRNLTVYVTHTNQSSIYWEPVTEADCVFSGEVMFASGQWNTIYFDKPFEYDGKSNIVVTVDDNTGKSSGGWGVLSNYIFYGDGNHVVARDNNKDIDPLDAASIENASQKNSYTYKSQIQFTFGDYPTPGNPAVTDIGDVSANVQCSLRGEATAWNLRYRKVAKEGEEEQRYVAVNDLDTRSYTIEGLDPATKYEVQVQAVFGEDNLSAWSDPLVFVTNCCPVEEQAEIIYAVNSNYSSWYGYAIQFMDITNEENPVEVAYINPIDYSFTGGTLTLCCGHKYKVNWIYDEEHSNVNGSFSLALYFEPGDKFFSMARGEAPEKTTELTTFVMDCTPYCAQMPQILNEAGTTYESATITFVSQTKKGQVVYSTEADFDPDKATPEDMDFEELPQSDVPWEQPNASLTLKGLQPLTAYYVRVRSVCTVEPIGTSRWSEPIKVITGSRYDGPTHLVAEPINSRTEKISWKNGGSSSKANIYYRVKVEGSPVNPDDIQTIGGGNGSGFEKGWFGEGTWGSGGNRPYSNILYVGNVPGNNTYSFQAGQGKSGMSKENFLYGMVEQTEATPLEQMRKLDRECLNDADRAARIKKLKNNITENEGLINLSKEALEDPSLTDEQKAELEKEIADLEKENEELNAELNALESLPTDEEKLERMEYLEECLEQYENLMERAISELEKGEITEEQYDEQMKSLNESYGKDFLELSHLRATTSAAENINKDGFSITYDVPSGVDTELPKSRALTRAGEDTKYVFFIRHSNSDGALVIKDITITPNEKMNEWTVIPNVSGTSYMLTGLDPSTTYEVMVEAVNEAGIAGSRSPIAAFTTIGEETDPVESEFSVAEDKKVQFAKGNLQHTGDMYEGTWSMAKQQYEMLGQNNVDKTEYGDSYTANLVDLFCWSTAKNYNGLSFFTYYEEEDAKTYFQGDFEDWGTNA